MVLPAVMFYFGIVYLSLDIFRMLGFKAPFRISSTPKGSVMPTALYALIEDVVAVDGGGGQMYRYALRTRYLSSPYFRRMLFEMNCFWSGGSILFAAAITAVVFTVQENVAFTVRNYQSGMESNRTNAKSVGLVPSVRLGYCLDSNNHSLGSK